MTTCFGLFCGHHLVKQGNLKRNLQSYRMPIVISRDECKERPKDVIHLTPYAIINLLFLTCIYYIILYIMLCYIIYYIIYYVILYIILYIMLYIILHVIAHNGDEPPKEEFIEILS